MSGCSSMVERQPSKLNTRVRFPSPAPYSTNPEKHVDNPALIYHKFEHFRVFIARIEGVY